jgi:hypothetical protein
MTAILTFEIGRRPGVARRQTSARKPAFGMNGAQRIALAEIVRGPREPQPSGSHSRRSSADFMWFAVLALVFVLSGRTLFEGVRFVHTADTLHAVKVAEPHVDVTITRLPPTTEALNAAAPAHSSATVSRTM